MEVWNEEWFVDLKIPRADAIKYATLFNDQGIMEDILRQDATSLESLCKLLEDDGVTLKPGHLRAVWRALTNPPSSPPPTSSSSVPSPSQASSVWNLYEKTKLIGSGAFGEVWEATKRHNGEIVAIKIIKQDDPGADLEDALRLARQELETMKGLRNQYIVLLLDYWIEESKTGIRPILVMERFPSDLKTVLHNTAPKFGTDGHLILRPSRNRDILLQAVKGLMYLHSQNLAHRDLKVRRL